MAARTASNHGNRLKIIISLARKGSPRNVAPKTSDGCLLCYPFFGSRRCREHLFGQRVVHRVRRGKSGRGERVRRSGSKKNRAGQIGQPCCCFGLPLLTEQQRLSCGGGGQEQLCGA